MDSPTLEKVIQAMAARHGSKFTEMLYDRNTGGIATGVTILVNGTQVGPMVTPLGETDEVAFLFPIAGGAYA